MSMVSNHRPQTWCWNISFQLGLVQWQCSRNSKHRTIGNWSYKGIGSIILDQQLYGDTKTIISTILQTVPLVSPVSCQYKSSLMDSPLTWADFLSLSVYKAWVWVDGSRRQAAVTGCWLYINIHVTCRPYIYLVALTAPSQPVQIKKHSARLDFLKKIRQWSSHTKSSPCRHKSSSVHQTIVML